MTRPIVTPMSLDACRSWMNAQPVGQAGIYAVGWADILKELVAARFDITLAMDATRVYVTALTVTDMFDAQNEVRAFAGLPEIERPAT